MDRLVQRNVLAMSGRAVEAAGDVTTLLLDKTGTITYGNRRASDFVAMPGVGDDELARVAALSSLADPTPEGTSVVELAADAASVSKSPPAPSSCPFTAQTRMSGLDLADGSQIRKGAGSAVLAWLGETARCRADVRAQLTSETDAIAQSGGTPLVVATTPTAQRPVRTARVLGVIHLKDIVKDGLRERFDELRRMGIRTVMITGDNPLTAKAIAAEAGVDDFLAEATPEDKLALIRREQEGGNLVAMTGDGTNDAPALAQADVGVAMNTGTSAAKEAGNMVDLDSDPTKLIDIVRIGKQLLITRGALTTFSLANDIAKYFAIIPAMFMGVFPGLGVLNVMGLHSPASAVMSAIIFNAIVIVALIPLALRGVKYRPASASPHPEPQPARSTASAASSRRSSASGSSTSSCASSRASEPRRRTRSCPPLAPPCVRRTSPSAPCSSSPLVLGVGYTLLITGIGQLALPVAGERLGRRDDDGDGRSAPRSSGSPSRMPTAHRCPSTSSRAPPPPATATTAAPRAAPTSGPRTADLITAIQDRRRRSPPSRASTSADIPADARHRLGIRPRPAHQPGLRAAAGRPGRGRRAASTPHDVRDLVESQDSGTGPRVPRRAAGQRAGAQPRARRPPGLTATAGGSTDEARPTAGAARAPRPAWARPTRCSKRAGGCATIGP